MSRTSCQMVALPRRQGLERLSQPACGRAQALRLAAAALRTSQSALGAYYRRLCARMDKPKAVTAAAHKLARLIYAMLTRGQPYTDQGQAYYEERYRERVVANLTRRAQQLGLQLVPLAGASPQTTTA
jgi:transposase